MKPASTVLARGTKTHEDIGTVVFLTLRCKFFGLRGVLEDNPRGGLRMPFDGVSA